MGFDSGSFNFIFKLNSQWEGRLDHTVHKHGNGDPYNKGDGYSGDSYFIKFEIDPANLA